MLVPGTIVMIDLDKFGEIVEERGWSEYRPNPATGLLTMLVERLVSKWQGVVLYGLDPDRGTEEVVIEIPYVEPEELLDDLKAIREELRKVGVTATIVAVRGYVGLKPTGDRREAYEGTPYRRLAAKLLRKAKRRGGDTIVIA
ncbi:hypothetical protein Pyrfu_0834 [Pyrolobus fumarii 1A]|uniref:Uncharacterized protein n=1 Tax=Pyrolobus fumarii (strain DSM 11204 / 1A) TaxID=694429 RepID=G0EDT4_PYRF1|nr:hypothetical protein [Pyrolobus fumarii]AEM38703.1 hypothetical protein Pyrfu_0834 [Pyrolobus fumarii 1A]